mgnify:CR=1 FL=1
MKREEDTERPPITEAMVNTATDEWLKSVHINPKFLSKTDIETEFLMAQREAEVLLPHNTRIQITKVTRSTENSVTGISLTYAYAKVVP